VSERPRGTALFSREEHQQLSQVGRGTPMGDLLRRYWMPALLSEELPEQDGPPVRVRLLGENLIAFRDSSGKVGLVGEYCPHRGASLFLGRNEEGGLRCSYHGWKYDTAGNILEMPNCLDPAVRSSIKQTAYPCREVGGIVWTYMGPADTMPALSGCSSQTPIATPPSGWRSATGSRRWKWTSTRRT
jgi:phthalate 4,5-dioxygenase oxygenase subunit